MTYFEGDWCAFDDKEQYHYILYHKLNSLTDFMVGLLFPLDKDAGGLMDMDRRSNFFSYWINRMDLR
jgi:hypothetical protein